MMYSGTPLVRPSLLRQKMAFQEGWLLSGIEINIFMFRFILSRGLSRGVASCQGGLSKGFQTRKLTLKVPLDNQFNCSIAVFFGDHLANNGTEANEFLFRLHNNLLLEHCDILVYMY